MKKTGLRKMVCILLACLFVFTASFPAFAGTPAEDAHLHFNEDGRFRILNFSDIQDDESLDSRVKVFLRQAVYAAQPDLIVLTGDNVYGDSLQAIDSTEKAIAQFMDIFESLGVPVAIVFGNHDSNGGLALSKEQQMRIYNRYSVSISYDEVGLSGCGTYNVPIYGSTETDKVMFNLWMFDTGSDINQPAFSKYDYMREDQLNWYVTKSNELKETNGGKLVPSIAFQHIIVNEIYDALDNVPVGTPGAVADIHGNYYVLPASAKPGSVMREKPNPSRNSNETEFSVVKQQGDVLAIVSGHDHRNSFVVPYQGIDLINTPSAGFYDMHNYCGDDDTRGARIIDIYEARSKHNLSTNSDDKYTTEMLTMRDLDEPRYSMRYGNAGKYVKNIALCVEQSAQYGGSREAATAAAYARLYTAVDAANGNGVALWADLNGGSTTDTSADNHYVICMGYTLTEDPAEAMRSLGLCYGFRAQPDDASAAHASAARASIARVSGASNNDTTGGNRTWYICNMSDFFIRGTDGPVNLNIGTNGDPFYFVADYDSSDPPLTEIHIVNNGPDNPIDMTDDCYSYSNANYDFTYSLVSAVAGMRVGSDYADLNRTASGDYVYALYKRDFDRWTYSLVDARALQKADFQARKLLEKPETLYSESSLTALQNALAQADEILLELDNNWGTELYDQASIDAATYQLVSSLQNLETASFTVTFDANGGTCSEQNRTFVYGTACGELPTASRTSTFFGKMLTYKFDGWFTERKGGEQITPETIFTFTSDQTWYAHWSVESGFPGGAVSVQPMNPVTGDPVESQHAGHDSLDDHQKPADRNSADVNADGTIDLRDITLLARHLAGGWSVEIEAANADINADGKVDLRDLALLRRYLAGGWKVELF